MTPIKRRYKVWVPDVCLYFEVDATITKDRIAFEVDTTGFIRHWRQWTISPEGCQAIGNAVAAHHHQVEMTAWDKLIRSEPTT